MTRAVVRWTDEELGFIQANSGMTNAQLAQELGRSRVAVECKRRALERGWAPQREQWTHDELFTLKNTGHLTAAEVGRLLGRSTTAVAQARRKHGFGVETFNKDPFTVGARPLIARTCRDCGQLLAAKWFAKDHQDGREYWMAICRKCASQRSGRNLKKRDDYDPALTAKVRQAVSLQTADRRYEPWLETDHETLADPDLTILEKALRLRRTYSGVAAAVIKYGYRSHVGLGDPEHDVWVIHNPNAAA